MTDRNIFGTLTKFCCPWEWKDWRGPNPHENHSYDDYKDIQEDCIDKFIDSAKSKPHVQKDFANVEFVKKYLR